VKDRAAKKQVAGKKKLTKGPRGQKGTLKKVTSDIGRQKGIDGPGRRGGKTFVWGKKKN